MRLCDLLPDMKIMNCFYIVLIASGLAVVSSSKCDRSPEGSSANKSPPDGRYRLRIVNDPIRYIPGETYNISLEGISRFAQSTPPKFVGFFLTVEKDFSDVRQTGNYDEKVGRFHISASAMTKFSEKCQNLVTHTSSFPKNEIMVLWTAPPPGAGCLVFKSTVIEHRDVWFSDDGALSRVLCEDEAEAGDTQPAVLSECTACDEAKYELTFEGMWSRHTHPKDFPDNGWLTKFSDVIGSSHTTDFRFWTYGEPSSDGLKELAEHGSTGQLEKELKDAGESIRTIIKARGIAYPNVTGKTFAVFRVDSSHHLVSVVSMIYPSPDWFVGVSGLELCLGNGSWVDEKILNLYPYDAGTDSGATYIASDQPTVPKEAIRRIKPNQPNDPRSPFHDPDNKEMKPLAKLILTRQRLYEKNCDSQDEVQNQETSSGKECQVTDWEDISGCDAACGQKGKKRQERQYLYSGDNCNKKLNREVDCMDAEETCNNEDEETQNELKSREQVSSREENVDSKCELTPWVLGECSKPCGKGTAIRTREYVTKDPNQQRSCKKHNKIPSFSETVECDGPSCSGPIDEDKEPPMKTQKHCPLKKPSPWTPCLTKCGTGERIRVKIPQKMQKHEENLQEITKLYNKLKNQNKRFNDDEEEEEDENDEEEEWANILGLQELSDPDHACYGTEMIERDECTVRKKCDNDLYEKPVFCMHRPPKKNCQETPENRWMFLNNKCVIYTYTGCPSKNNFETYDTCMEICARPVARDLQALSLVRNRDFREPVDCRVSHWRHEPCNATCGTDGFKWKHRSIVQHPQNGGLPCPRTMHFERCYRECGNSKPISTSPVGNAINPHHHQCRYSGWSAWSPCSKTCGDSAVQIRTRTVLNHLHSHLCNERLEERRCEVMPCLVGNGYSYNYNYRS